MLAAHDGSAFEESYNLLERLARGHSRQRRVQPAPAGASRDEPRRPELPVHAGSAASRRAATCERRRCWRSRRRQTRRTAFNLHVDDVGHTLVLGATGQRQELPAQLPRHAPAAVRPVHRRPRPWPQLPEARRRCSRAATWSSASASRASRSTRSTLRADRRSSCTSCTRSRGCCSRARTATA